MEVISKGKWVMPTEVYSRVVGYYRPVDNWNHSKKQEFEDRILYDKGIIKRGEV